jgi:hypothetical protein
MLWDDFQRNESCSRVLLQCNIELLGVEEYFCLICMAISETEDNSNLRKIYNQ